MAKLSYKSFETSEQFEEWQDENPDCLVCSVSPLAQQVSGEEYNGRAEVTLNWGCFVLYKRETKS